jgi:hypothetical protein
MGEHRNDTHAPGLMYLVLSSPGLREPLYRLGLESTS